MKRVLTRKVVIATLILASLLLCASLTDVLVGIYTAPPVLATTRLAITILAAPSSTPRYVPPTPTPLPPTPLPSPTPGPGQFALGVYVQITGTGGVGLNMRSDAGLKAPVLFLGYDTEVYQITKGPKQADGDTWWYLTAPYDQTRSGWAAQNYLSVLPSP
jgi:hypothetical protein